MTDHRQVMQQALEALQDITNYDKLAFARLALRQALAAPQDEPAADMNAELRDVLLAIRNWIGLEGAAPQAEPVVLSQEWTPCVKLPVTVHVREQRPGERHISTREGITPIMPTDLIMRGVQGEEYPIGRELFKQTYRLGTHPAPAADVVRDAERYRWLRDTNHDLSIRSNSEHLDPLQVPVIYIGHPEDRWTLGSFASAYVGDKFDRAIDAAIDAAMKGADHE